MSTTDKIKQYLSLAGGAIHALEVLGTAAKELLGNGPHGADINQAMLILQTLAAVTDSVRQGVDGDASIEVIEDSLRELVDGLKHTDAAIDAAIDNKFGG